MRLDEYSSTLSKRVILAFDPLSCDTFTFVEFTFVDVTFELYILLAVSDVMTEDWLVKLLEVKLIQDKFDIAAASLRRFVVVVV